MPPAERVELSATLAEWDLSLFCAARGLARDEGPKILLLRLDGGIGLPRA